MKRKIIISIIQIMAIFLIILALYDRLFPISMDAKYNPIYTLVSPTNAYCVKNFMFKLMPNKTDEIEKDIKSQSQNWLNLAVFDTPMDCSNDKTIFFYFDLQRNKFVFINKQQIMQNFITIDKTSPDGFKIISCADTALFGHLAYIDYDPGCLEKNGNTKEININGRWPNWFNLYGTSTPPKISNPRPSQVTPPDIIYPPNVPKNFIYHLGWIKQ